MGEKLHAVSGKEFARFLEKRGFKRERQTGSHIILFKSGIKRSLVVPDYKRLPEFIVLNNLKTAGISREEYHRAMRRR